MGWIIGLTIGILIAIGAQTAVRAGQMPKATPISGIDALGNARQVTEGYTLSGMISAVSVGPIKRRGIKAVLSAVEPDQSTISLLRSNGIEWDPIPIGSTFYADRAAVVDDVASRYRPDQILIHCTHGADRSGVVLAFLLATRHGWTISDALYAVVSPTDTDTTGLASVLAEYGIQDARRPSSPGVGIYSPAAVGHSGGLKVRSDGYRQLVSSTIDEIGARSAP